MYTPHLTMRNMLSPSSPIINFYSVAIIFSDNSIRLIVAVRVTVISDRHR